MRVYTKTHTSVAACSNVYQRRVKSYQFEKAKCKSKKKRSAMKRYAYIKRKHKNANKTATNECIRHTYESCVHVYRLEIHMSEMQ